MGYMGFGMRKEVYARKPKKAFAKIKKHTVKHPYKISESARSDREVYVHRYQKPAYQRWWFLLAIAISLTAATLFFLKTRIWQPSKLDKAIVIFEDADILEYYLDKKTGVDSIFSMMHRTNGALAMVGFDDYNNEIKLELRSRNKPIGRRTSVTFSTVTPYQYFVENDKLMYHWNDATMKEADDWSASIWFKKTSEIDESLFDHIGASTEELNRVAQRVYQEAWALKIHPRGHIWEFQKYGQWYTFYITNDISKLTLTPEDQLKQLMPGVYWH